ncbi:glycosyltransferase family 4 protein [Clostridium sp. YIM B02515]|uniref:Glycosyltransferase family 4 protein n=1 Tax=Clostridium rhizosphaerae TaxID=2803861 RepID=A0ABS1TFP4_9CLOT|nr:glycosyltransferase family 4 protein [Clostridium rhizosphaerae]MBL4938125.1 glycosyltransferase family 4 protein [Clostridium rhizosphaerae]
MRNILMIAYYYPPLGGAGVQRTLKFSKFLSKMGYNISVLTVLNDSNTIKDDSMTLEVIDGIKVYRAKQGKYISLSSNISKNKESKLYIRHDNLSSDKSVNIKIKNVIKNIFKKIYANINIPDDKISWRKDAVRLGLEIIHQNSIDIIYSTSGPYTSHLIAYELKRKTNLKWIADFRDQWVSNPFVKYMFIPKEINKYLERKVIEKSDRVISVSKPIIDDFINRYEKIDKNKFSVITNGYDEEDFNDYDINKKIDKFIITYNGTIYGKRSPKNFLKAVDSLIIDHKIDKKNIIIQFVGQLGNDGKREIQEFVYKYNDKVELIEYLPHKQSIKQLERSSALLLIIEGGEGSEGIYTGKVFEYIRSGRFIIGIVPEGVAKNLIQETNTGMCCSPNSIKEIAEVINTAYKIWLNEGRPLNINWNEVKKYERENIAKQLSIIIKNL